MGVRGAHGFGGPLPGRHVRFVVVGVTNGRSFTRNPCLQHHLRWVRRHHVWAAAYAMSTFPTREQVRRHAHTGPFRHRDHRGRLANAAWATARFNVATMRRAGFRTPHVWLDIEPSSVRPWGRRADNRVVVRAWVRAYRTAGYRVGLYSTPYLWHSLLGDLRLGLPEWRTAGPAPARAALAKCATDRFQGGRAVIAQWWTTSRDYDRACPGFRSAREMSRFFHRY
jgi:hypothetical protein